LGELFRWFRLAFRLFACRQPPRALLKEWQRKEFPQCELMFLPIRSNTDDDGILRHVSSQRAMEFIPPAKNRAPVRIGLALHDGMMNAVHARCDKYQVQNPLQLNRQSPVGMMKESRSLECDKEHDQHYWADAKEDHCKRKKADGKNHLAKMESRGGAHVEVKIGVMHVMKTPKTRRPAAACRHSPSKEFLGRPKPLAPTRVGCSWYSYSYSCSCSSEFGQEYDYKYEYDNTTC